MPDRRRQRQQRVRQEAGDDPRSVGASNREPVKQEPQQNNVSQPKKHNTTGVAYAEPKEYESVTIMPDKEVQAPQKYQRREILSSWLRYEDLPPEEAGEDGEDYLIGEDFSTILEQQVSTGGHLMLKGENLLDDNETSILKSHGIGSLHVADLVAAINTIPLQVQLNIPEASLPESVIEFYTNLAADNKKLYEPSNNYNDCMDVNEKILQSLKLGENEPLNLASESTVNQENTNKNAVDVALSLSSAFEPEPEDVDLDDLVRDPSPEKASEEVRSLSPVKQPSPVKEPSPRKEPMVVKEPTPDKQLTPVKEPTPVKEVNPVKQSSNPEAPTNDKRPVRPKQLSIEKQSVPQNDPSSVLPVTSLPNSNQNEMPKDKNQTTFNFGLPKTSTSNIPMNFGVPKPDGGFQANSIIANALKDVDLGNHSKEEKVPEGPTIDLDAPVTSTKPVLLVDKTEAEDLEDWLDSVLDD